jgi:adenylate cyclase
MALLGFSQAGREISRLNQLPGWTAQMVKAARAPGRAENAFIIQVIDGVWYGYVLLLALVLAARGVRCARENHGAKVRIIYPGGREILAPVGASVLEASREAGIPHASVCGGRGRCSTCRVRVLKGLEGLEAASPSEQGVLDRIGAPPNVRLACQTWPVEEISVYPVLPHTAQAGAGASQPGYSGGQDREITVLFADIRGFTTFSEKKLPYDVVFFLNRYFEVMGDAIDGAGGTVNQFVGDGVMALFGMDTSPEEGSRQAIIAAGAMAEGLREMNESLAEEMDAPLRIGIGIHTGPAVVGRIGRGEAIYLTAVGDTVNTASRLQDLTKEYNCQLIVSAQAAESAGFDASGFPRHEITVRNRSEPIVIRTIDDARGIQAGGS